MSTVLGQSCHPFISTQAEDVCRMDNIKIFTQFILFSSETDTPSMIKNTVFVTDSPQIGVHKVQADVCRVTYQVFEYSLGTCLDQYGTERLHLLQAHGIMQRCSFQLEDSDLCFTQQ